MPNAPELSTVRRDSTIGRAPVNAVGAPPKKSRIMRAAVAGVVSVHKSLALHQVSIVGYRLRRTRASATSSAADAKGHSCALLHHKAATKRPH